jgi:hypothetical protein
LRGSSAWRAPYSITCFIKAKLYANASGAIHLALGGREYTVRAVAVGEAYKDGVAHAAIARAQTCSGAAESDCKNLRCAADLSLSRRLVVYLLAVGSLSSSALSGHAAADRRSARAHVVAR